METTEVQMKVAGSPGQSATSQPEETRKEPGLVNMNWVFQTPDVKTHKGNSNPNGEKSVTQLNRGGVGREGCWGPWEEGAQW